MAFDGITVRCLADELDRILSGGRITKITQPRPYTILLTCKTAQGQHRLLLSADASLPLAYLTEAALPAPADAPAFCMLLRKNLGSGRILRVSVPDLERVLQISVEHRNELGDLTLRVLSLELMGKHSNLILCDENGLILDAVKRIPGTVSSVREVLPGRTYFIPAQEGRVNLLTDDGSSFAAVLSAKPQTLGRAVCATLTGISPFFANELCTRAALEADRPAAALTTGDVERLWTVLEALRADILAKHWNPRIVMDPVRQLPVEFSPLPLTMYPEAEQRPDGSISAVLESYYRLREVHHAMQQRSGDLRRHVQNLLERAVKKSTLLEKQLSDTEKRDQYRLWGELLHVYGHAAAPGQRELRCVDYHTEEEIVIPLDPEKTAMENAQAYYERFGKLKRREAALRPQLEEALLQTDQLQSVLLALDLAEDAADLDEISRELTDLGYLKKQTRAAQGKRMQKSHPLHYRTGDGFDIYIGKNNEQNDFVTFHLADPEDWWFHTKSVHGSHVIVKAGGKELPDRVFETAAALAAWYSQGRDSSRVEVDYVRRRFLKKPKKAAAGYVIYHTNYSMVVTPSLSDAESVP